MLPQSSSWILGRDGKGWKREGEGDEGKGQEGRWKGKEGGIDLMHFAVQILAAIRSECVFMLSGQSLNPMHVTPAARCVSSADYK